MTNNDPSPESPLHNTDVGLLVKITDYAEHSLESLTSTRRRRIAAGTGGLVAFAAGVFISSAGYEIVSLPLQIAGITGISASFTSFIWGIEPQQHIDALLQSSPLPEPISRQQG